MTILVARSQYADAAPVVRARAPSGAARALAAPPVELVAKTPLRIGAGDAQRAGIMASLLGAHEQLGNNRTSPLATLARSELVAMAYGEVSSAASPQLQRDAEKQLADNDADYLRQAADLAAASGDERVRLTAGLALELARTPMERARHDRANDLVTERLQHDLRIMDAASGGEPLALSLRYPHGWTAPARAAAQPSVPSGNAAAVSRGADRTAQAYRASLDD